MKAKMGRRTNSSSSIDEDQEPKASPASSFTAGEPEGDVKFKTADGAGIARHPVFGSRGKHQGAAAASPMTKSSPRGEKLREASRNKVPLSSFKPGSSAPPTPNQDARRKSVLRGAEKKKKAGMTEKDKERAERLAAGQRERAAMGEARKREEDLRRKADEKVSTEKARFDQRDLDLEEEAWKRIGEAKVLTVADLPGLSAAAMRARLLNGDSKKVFKELNLRWHPDKFLPKYQAVISKDELEEVREAVTKTWRNIRAYSEKLEAKR